MIDLTDTYNNNCNKQQHGQEHQPNERSLTEPLGGSFFYFILQILNFWSFKRSFIIFDLIEEEDIARVLTKLGLFPDDKSLLLVTAVLHVTHHYDHIVPSISLK